MEQVHPHKQTGFRSPLAWICIGVAILAVLFVCFTASTKKEVVLTIPVTCHAIPDGLILTGPPVKGIEVRVKGRESAIDNIQKEDPGYDLSLKGLTVGEFSIKVNDLLIRLPKGVKRLETLTESISVRLEKEVKKTVSVTPLLAGEAAPGYKIKSIVIKPAEITLQGPENLLKDISQISTMQIDVSGINDSFKKEIALNFPEGTDTDRPLKIVKVQIEIGEEIGTRKFPDIPVYGKGGKQKHDIRPRLIHLEISGPLLILDKLQAKNQLKAYVDLENLGPGVYVRRASIPLPLGTSLVSVEPEIFTITIK